MIKYSLIVEENNTGYTYYCNDIKKALEKCKIHIDVLKTFGITSHKKLDTEVFLVEEFKFYKEDEELLSVYSYNPYSNIFEEYNANILKKVKDNLVQFRYKYYLNDYYFFTTEKLNEDYNSETNKFEYNINGKLFQLEEVLECGEL